MKRLFFLGWIIFCAPAHAVITTIVPPPAGNNGEVQINKRGIAGTDSTFTIDTTTHRVSMSSASVTYLGASTAAFNTFTYGTCDTTPQLIYDGDSLTVGADANIPYSNAVITNVTFSSSNVAVSGRKLTNMIAAAPESVDAKYTRCAKFNIAVIWGGTNDIAIEGASVGTAYARLVAYCNYRRAKGFKVIVLTMISRTSVDTQKNSYNDLIRANWQRFSDGLADVAVSTSIGADGAYASLTYFSDGTHPTVTGYALVSPIVSAAINRLTDSDVANVPYLAVNSTTSFTTATIQARSTRAITSIGGYTVPWGITDVRASNDTSFSGFFALKSRLTTTTTPYSLAPVTVGDGLGALIPFPYDGTGFLGTGYAGFLVDGSTGTGSIPTAYAIATGSTGFGGEQLRITSAGRFGINDTTPDAQLDIKSNAAPTGFAVQVSSQDDTTFMYQLRGDGIISTPNNSAVFAYRVNTDTVTTSLLQIALDTEAWDTRGEFSTTNSSFTATVAGKYQVCGQVSTPAPGIAGILIVKVLQNSTSVLAVASQSTGNDSLTAGTCGTLNLSANDTLALHATLNTGTAAIYATRDLTFLSITKIQ